jgi:hypothetical protein
MGEAKRRKLAAQRSQVVKPSLAIVPSGAIAAASLLAALSMGVSKVALAQTCGPLDASGSVTCTTGGNNYTSGINYGNTGVPTTVTLDPGVVVNVTPGSNVNVAVGVSTGTAPGAGLPATLIANNAAVTVGTTSNPAPGTTSALFLHPILGDATITASGTLNAIGTGNTNAIWAFVQSTSDGSVARVTYNGAAIPGVPDINVIGGSNSTAIQA